MNIKWLHHIFFRVIFRCHVDHVIIIVIVVIIVTVVVIIQNRSMSTTNSTISDSSQDSEFATRSMVTNMANILKDVMCELQVLKNTPHIQ